MGSVLIGSEDGTMLLASLLELLPAPHGKEGEGGRGLWRRRGRGGRGVVMV